MKKVALIVEGKGDVAAAPSLVAKTAAIFGLQVIPADPPIRAGEAVKLRRVGELERFLELAVSRPDVDEVILLVDLDDGCAKDISAEFNSRAAPISLKYGKPIEICFCVREYEGWFLADLKNLSDKLPEYGIDTEVIVADPEAIRPAKETLRERCQAKGYKQMRDQLLFTKKLDVIEVTRRSRSFRRLVKAITGLSYAQVSAFCDNNL